MVPNQWRRCLSFGVVWKTSMIVGERVIFFLLFFCNFHQTDSLGECCGRQEFKKHTNSNFMKDHLGCSSSFPLTDSVSWFVFWEGSLINTSRTRLRQKPTRALLMHCLSIPGWALDGVSYDISPLQPEKSKDFLNRELFLTPLVYFLGCGHQPSGVSSAQHHWRASHVNWNLICCSSISMTQHW